MLENSINDLGKKPKKNEMFHGRKNQSLSYHTLCHNLDVMHIEKNIFDYIIETLLDILGKTKDHEKTHFQLARQDNSKEDSFKRDKSR